jgi:hypothetical protein
MAGTNFPVSEHYKESIKDGLTISRVGSWWTSVLLIEEPLNKKKFLCIYRWQLVDGEWKTRSKFKVNSVRDAEKLSEILLSLKINME